MKAILVEKEGREGKLIFGEAPEPEPAANEILIKARATSVNQADLLQKRGLYPPPPGVTNILGLDIAGEVVELGEKVTRWKVGDRVFGFVAGGGYGEYVSANEYLIWPIPPALDFESAAAMGEVFATAYLNLIILGRLEQGKKILIHGGSGGVGTAAIQLAGLVGATVFTTVATEEGKKLCDELGAEYIINYEKEDFAKKILEFSPEGVDLVLDFIGAPYLDKHLEILAEYGTLILIGLKGGTKSEIFLPPILTKKLKIIGSTLRGLSFERKKKLVVNFERKVLPHIGSGRIFPVIDSIFPITQAEEAHQRFSRSKHLGKIVLTWYTV